MSTPESDSNDYDDYDDIDLPDDGSFIRTVSHPCEDYFDIEPNSTELIIPKQRQVELSKPETYDEKDTEIEENYQEVYDKSMDMFDVLERTMEGVDSKYRARNAEVAIQMLNTALSAAKEKGSLKSHKDKMEHTTSKGGPVINANTINISTSDLIKQLAEGASPAANFVPQIIEQDLTKNPAEVVEDTPVPKRTTIKRKKK